MPALLASLVASLAASPLAAGDALTPAGAVTRALAGNPALQAALAGVDEAGGRVRQARAAAAPRVSFREIGVWSDSGLLGVAFSALQKDPAGFLRLGQGAQDFLTQLWVNLPVLSGGQISGHKREAALGQDAARQERFAAINDTLFEVLKTYYDAALAAQVVEVRSSTVHRAQQQVVLGQARVRQDMLLASELLHLQVDLSAAREDEISARHDLALAQARLATLLGDPAGSTYAIDGPLDARKEPLLSPSPDAPRPELVAKDRQIAIAGIDETLARRSHEPRMGLFGGVEFDARNLDLANSSTTYGVMVDLDVFDGGDAAGRKAEARARGRRLSLERRSLEDRIALERREAELRLEEALDRLAIARQAIGPAEENFRIVTSRFQEGMATSFNVVDARLALTQAQMSRLRAQHAVTLALLSRLRAGGALARISGGSEK